MAGSLSDILYLYLLVTRTKFIYHFYFYPMVPVQVEYFRTVFPLKLY